MSATAGSSSYSTTTASAASRARFLLSAITTATAWPTNRTVSGAIAGHAPILIGEPSLEVTAQPQIRLPTLSSTICRPVRTATTPGIASAAEESMLLTLAWACGLRMKWA